MIFLIFKFWLENYYNVIFFTLKYYTIRTETNIIIYKYIIYDYIIYLLCIYLKYCFCNKIHLIKLKYIFSWWYTVNQEWLILLLLYFLHPLLNWTGICCMPKLYWHVYCRWIKLIWFDLIWFDLILFE
jgi:hypothetical protein